MLPYYEEMKEGAGAFNKSITNVLGHFQETLQSVSHQINDKLIAATDVYISNPCPKTNEIWLTILSLHKQFNEYIVALNSKNKIKIDDAFHDYLDALKAVENLEKEGAISFNPPHPNNVFVPVNLETTKSESNMGKQGKQEEQESLFLTYVDGIPQLKKHYIKPKSLPNIPPILRNITAKYLSSLNGFITYGPLYEYASGLYQKELKIIRKLIEYEKVASISKYLSALNNYNQPLSINYDNIKLIFNQINFQIKIASQSLNKDIAIENMALSQKINSPEWFKYYHAYIARTYFIKYIASIHRAEKHKLKNGLWEHFDKGMVYENYIAILNVIQTYSYQLGDSGPSAISGIGSLNEILNGILKPAIQPIFSDTTNILTKELPPNNANNANNGFVPGKLEIIKGQLGKGIQLEPKNLPIIENPTSLPPLLINLLNNILSDNMAFPSQYDKLHTLYLDTFKEMSNINISKTPLAAMSSFSYSIYDEVYINKEEIKILFHKINSAIKFTSEKLLDKTLTSFSDDASLWHDYYQNFITRYYLIAYIESIHTAEKNKIINKLWTWKDANTAYKNYIALYKILEVFWNPDFGITLNSILVLKHLAQTKEIIKNNKEIAEFMQNVGANVKEAATLSDGAFYDLIMKSDLKNPFLADKKYQEQLKLAKQEFMNSMMINPSLLQFTPNDFTKEQPIISKEQPIISKEEPITSKEQPITSKEQPITSKEQPITSKEQPPLTPEQIEHNNAIKRSHNLTVQILKELKIV